MNDTHVHTRPEARPPFWVSRRGARVALIALHLAALLAVLIELFHPIGDSGHGAERVAELEFLASYAVYGFVACVVLVLLGHVLRWLVMRDENYYTDGER